MNSVVIYNGSFGMFTCGYDDDDDNNGFFSISYHKKGTLSQTKKVEKISKKCWKVTWTRISYKKFPKKLKNKI